MYDTVHVYRTYNNRHQNIFFYILNIYFYITMLKLCVFLKTPWYHVDIDYYFPLNCGFPRYRTVFQCRALTGYMI